MNDNEILNDYFYNYFSPFSFLQFTHRTKKTMAKNPTSSSPPDLQELFHKQSVALQLNKVSDEHQKYFKYEKFYRNCFLNQLFNSGKQKTGPEIIKECIAATDFKKQLNQEQLDLMKEHQDNYNECGHYRFCFDYDFVHNPNNKTAPQIIKDCIEKSHRLHQTHHFFVGTDAFPEPDCSIIGSKNPSN